ncbi:DNA-binding transcriptional regulator YiaG [Paraburkholderia sp. UCT70]|uniref:hypothetical protein n=1 Tax=Paraburkholderia sp. UCT70 TaxID=2991068 RepID=UPI003D24DC36
MYAVTGMPRTPVFRPLTGSNSDFGEDALEIGALPSLSHAYYVVGTMGLLTPHFLEQRSATSNWGIQYENSEAATRQQTCAPVDLLRTPAEDLARIREVLKPPVLELANLFGVSRQAVYAWQDGAQPSAEAMERLAMLARAADVFSDAGVSVGAQTLRRKVTGGGTVLDAVLNGGDAVDVAKALLKTLEREDAQRAHLSKQFRGRKRAPVYVDDYGSPSLEDDA